MSHIGRFWNEGGKTCQSCGDEAGKFPHNSTMKKCPLNTTFTTEICEYE